MPGATLYASAGALLATGLHQVDNPVFGVDGALYVTYSGSRGQAASVSIFRIPAGGAAREPFVHGLVNPTSMTIGPDGRLYVSSRFEGRVYRVFDDGRYEVMASDLGVACGLAFDAEGALYVGDRGGTIFRIHPSGRTETFATVGSSDPAWTEKVCAMAMARDPITSWCLLGMRGGRLGNSSTNSGKTPG